MERSDFRVKEFNGLFEIQRKSVTKKTTGFLWWKKTITETEWKEVDKQGQFFWRLGSEMRKFTSLEKAIKKIDMIVNGASYHYLKN